MARTVLLDSGPLGEITHPRSQRRQQIREWLFELLDGGVYPRLPEIVDYEHRRKLLHLGSGGSIRRLDEFRQVFGYEPLTTETMLSAAQLWADARKRATNHLRESAGRGRDTGSAGAGARRRRR